MATDNKKVRSIGGKRLIMRGKLWPQIDNTALWLRKEQVGFTTIPRALNLIGRIMDQLSGKGFPLFGTYFTLWCRVYDEAYVEIRNERELAFESGFTGSRGVTTWRSRMRRLQELGFIDLRPGLASEFQYVLILNPILVISAQNAMGKVDSMAYQAFLARLIEVGAVDGD